MWRGVLICCVTALAGLALLHQGPKAPPSDAGVCWVERPAGSFVPLDRVDNLETCGARLEVVYLRQGRPVRGAYAGINVSVDASAITAAAPNGPPIRLITIASRPVLDADIRQLLKANGEAISPPAPGARPRP